MHRLQIDLWPTASTTSGRARRTLLSVRSSNVPVFVSGTVRSADLKTVTLTVIFARSSVDLDTMPASSAYKIPQTDLHTHASGSTSNPPSPMSSSRCIHSLKMSGSSLKLSGTECIAVRRKIHCEERQYTSGSLPQSLIDVMLFMLFTVIRTHATSHGFVELVNNDQHRLWYVETCEHHSQPLWVDGILCHLEIDEEHPQRHSPSLSEFLLLAHDEFLKYIPPRYKGRAGTPPRIVIAQGDAFTPGLRPTKSWHHSSNH